MNTLDQGLGLGVTGQGQGTPKAGCFRTVAIVSAALVALLVDCSWELWFH